MQVHKKKMEDKMIEELLQLVALDKVTCNAPPGNPGEINL